MKVSELYFKTMKFVWLKLAVGFLTLLFVVILVGITAGLIYLLENTVISIILIVVCGVVIRIVGDHVSSYTRYLIRAGHIAIIQRAVITGTIPENQFQVGKEMVQSRFLSSSTYFLINNLVSGSVRQLQHGMDKVDNMFEDIPGLSSLVSFGKLFIGIALGYVDECCLGYTFYKEDESAFKGSCDAVVIYFQSWKKLMKAAFFTTLQVIGITVALFIGVIILVGSIFSLLGWHILIALFISIFLVIIIKGAFLDSYMMIKMMVSFLAVAPSTEISFDLYKKLSNISKKFKELYDKSKVEITKALH